MKKIKKIKKIERFKSRKERENYLVEKFLETLEKANSPKKISNFLNNLLSDKEKINISRRLAVIALLKEGKTYREIGEILWISPGTISVIKKTLLNYKNYRSKHSFYGKDVIRTEAIQKMKAIPPETFFDHLAKIKWPRIAYIRKERLSRKN